MNATGKKLRRSIVSPSEKDKKVSETDSQTVRITLTQAERELLLKACMKYRYTIPAYFQSRQAELETLNAIINKLS
jgi:ABC-type oligopeptide transport system substrate-binding subunit